MLNQTTYQNKPDHQQWNTKLPTKTIQPTNQPNKAPEINPATKRLQPNQSPTSNHHSTDQQGMYLNNQPPINQPISHLPTTKYRSSD